MEQLHQQFGNREGQRRRNKYISTVFIIIRLFACIIVHYILILNEISSGFYPYNLGNLGIKIPF